MDIGWFGSYNSSLKGVICDEAFSHPAKFAYGLICRIYTHLLERGYLQEGGLVADPFAGVGVGGIVAAANGLYWIGVELEQKFVDLAEDSFSLHRETWEKMGKPYPVIIQGDSRQLSALIREAVDLVITSPPYEGTHVGLPEEQAMASQGRGREIGSKNYAIDSDNIGNQEGDTYWEAVSEVYQECLKALKPGGVMAVVVKAFVRNKKIVDLPSQTLELLTAIGFEPLERIRAWMTSPVTQKSLMPDIRPDYTKARKSFFRRLYESKYPENRIDFEEVLIVRKKGVISYDAQNQARFNVSVGCGFF